MDLIVQIGELLQWNLLLLMVGSVLFGLIIGILPGLGGSVALALLIPLTFSLSPEAAIVVLLTAYGASNFGGSLTSILINTPGDAANAATTFDGYPLAKQGKGRMAISAAMFASAMGGFIGLIVLYLLIPVARELVLAFSYPDFFMLAVCGLLIIAFVTQGNTYRGVVSALAGLLLAFVGTDPIYGAERYVFNVNYLLDGISLLAVIIGLFAVTEAFTLFANNKAIASDVEVKKDGSLEGIVAVCKHFGLFLRSCAIGIIIGIIPGVGGTVSSYMAYGTAVQLSNNPEKFGKGAIEGVIAVEASNDAKEGGALLPTLAFGIPGSAAMAVLIGGLMFHGLAPGPSMLTNDLDLTYFLIAAAILGKVIAMIIGLFLGPRLVFVTKIKGSLMAPGIIAISLLGAYGVEGKYGDVIVALLFGVFGFYMQKYGYSRIGLIIALVLGKMLESTYHQSVTTFGYSGFFTRPISLTLLFIAILMFFWPSIRKAIKNRKEGGRQA